MQRRKRTKQDHVPIGYGNHTNAFDLSPHNIGTMSEPCQVCGALLFKGEITRSKRSGFSLCCSNGLVKLPPLDPLPGCILDLLSGSTKKCKDFRKNVRAYNSSLSFASLSANVDGALLRAEKGVYSFKIHGNLYHLIGTALPKSGEKPQFGQIYIYDTDHEIDNRYSVVPFLEKDTLLELQEMMHEVNPYVAQFLQAAELLKTNEMFLRITDSKTLDRRVYNRPASDDIAVILNEKDLSRGRDIVIRARGDGAVVRIPETHGGYDPLHFVLMFPKGEYGWTPDIQQEGAGKTVSPMDFYSNRLMFRPNCYHILLFGRLLHEYIVTAFTTMEICRLRYLRDHQKEIRAEQYDEVQSAIERGSDLCDIGRRVILPSSYIGSPRNYHQLYQDAMAIVRDLGRPTLFITFTCNPLWSEIQENLIGSQSANDRPDLCSRVFDLKLKSLKCDLITKGVLGKVVGDVSVIEWQKRGLPHAHILLIMDKDSRPKYTEDIDEIVSAEIPDRDRCPNLYRTVASCMMHGPCGSSRKSCPCMIDGKCSKNYPRSFVENTQVAEDGYPLYRRRNNGDFVEKNGIKLDNRWVVPYNPFLLSHYDAHINVEICGSVQAIKYLYKYVYKGGDKAVVEIGTEKDEIKSYLEGRYISASEAVWRLFGKKLHDEHPTVYRLDVHLENQETIYFGNGTSIARRVTSLTAWFLYNQHNTDAKSLLYTEMPKRYTYSKSLKSWKPRQTGPFNTVGRLYMVSPAAGEKYFLRLLLHHVRGSKSFSDLRTVNGITLPTYREAAGALGLLEDDKEWDDCMIGAALYMLPKQLRELFSTIVVFCSIANVEDFWDRHKGCLTEDFVKHGERNPDLKALIEIENCLQTHGRSLEDCGVSLPANVQAAAESKILQDEDPCNFPESAMIAKRNVNMLNDEQKAIFEAVVTSVSERRGLLTFVEGPGGSGKSFLFNTILAHLRSAGHVALAVASSGIAAMLLDGGRTAHSRFKLPLEPHEESSCSVSLQSVHAELLRRTQIIIWDEAPMAHRFLFEALDRLLRDVMKSEMVFGGKILILGGDFRQILPVIKRGSRADTVNASIQNSYLWSETQVFRLKTNLRAADNTDMFPEFLLSVGNGDGELKEKVAVPKGSLIPSVTLQICLNAVFGKDILAVEDLKETAFLCPRNEDVRDINNTLVRQVAGDLQVYLSVDSIEDEEKRAHYTVEFLNSIELSGIPSHTIMLKVGCPIMLLRNLNPCKGLCNGTRLTVKSLQKNFIEAVIVTGRHAGETVAIPRIVFASQDSQIPFVLKRRQFPVSLAFAFTINKAQGQTLAETILFLKSSVFSHGQLYVGLSRSTSWKKLKICLPENHSSAKNVIYKEALLKC